jgi:hypothetical protein
MFLKGVKKCVPQVFDFPQWSGQNLEVTFDLDTLPYIVFAGGDALMKIMDYTTSSDTIHFLEPIVNLNVQVVKLCGGVSPSITTNLNLGKYKNDLLAQVAMTSNPLVNQYLYRLTADNDYAMSENSVRYLERT